MEPKPHTRFLRNDPKAKHIFESYNAVVRSILGGLTHDLSELITTIVQYTTQHAAAGRVRSLSTTHAKQSFVTFECCSSIRLILLSILRRLVATNVLSIVCIHTHTIAHRLLEHNLP